MIIRFRKRGKTLEPLLVPVNMLPLPANDNIGAPIYWAGITPDNWLPEVF